MSDKTKKQPNVNALEQEQTLLKYAGLVQAVGIAILAAKTQSAANSEASEGVRSTVAESVRQYAAETAAAGVPAKEAGDMLRTGLKRMEFPSGTADNYGRAVEGFRKLASDPATEATWQTASVKDAQKAMESPETAALNELRAEIAKYTAAGTLAQLKDVLEACQLSGIVPKQKKVKTDTSASPAKDVTAEVVQEREAEAA